MVAVIHASSSLRNILNYNEHKVKASMATCLEAALYPKDAADLNFFQKLSRLEKLTELNQRTKVNSVHISLNFDPAEQLSAAQLQDITAEYMEKIGFTGQPYLLYQHLDSGHPHVHIVTTNIRADGTRISLHNLGRNQSETARKKIEIAYGLVQAEQSILQRSNKLKPVNLQKVEYGRTGTKQAIGNVLNAIVPHYKYTSLAELNAVLRQYNVIADRGEESSRIFRHQGLVYRIIGENGDRAGIPIKASLFFSKPTLSFLAERFKISEAERLPHRSRIKNSVDLALLKQPGLSLDQLMRALEKDGINLVLRQNSGSIIYGMTYIDHRTRCVFNGSALGKSYSAKGILERCTLRVAGEQKVKVAVPENFREVNDAGHQRNRLQQSVETVHSDTVHGGNSANPGGLLPALLEPDQLLGLPFELKAKRRKKKRHKINH